MSREALTRRVQQVVMKIAHGKATTAEDVHMAAIAWAIAEQQKEAAAGDTTAADLDLLRVVRAHEGAGDATAQAICDAATTWRRATQLDDDAGDLRRLLAQAVDHHHGRARRRRTQLRTALAAAIIAITTVVADFVLGVEGVPDWPVRLILAAVGLVAFLTAIVLVWRVERTERR